MKFSKCQVLALFSALLLISACSVIHSGATDQVSHDSANKVLSEKTLANATYRIDEFGAFQLVNGEYQHQYGEGRTQLRQIRLEKLAFGDLDSDGVTDAAVILALQSGGSGTFKYLVAILDTGDAFSQQDSVLLGDRINISAMTIAGGRLDLEMVVAGSTDPACCPGQQFKQSYALRDGKWLKTDLVNGGQADFVSHSSTDITGIVWKLKRYDEPLESGNFNIDNPTDYTLILLPNRHYRVKADCNRMQGAYTLDGKKIKIAPGAATLAECAPGSKYAQYLRYLAEAVSFEINENNLQLNLINEKGQLVFENGGRVADNLDSMKR
ncbi:META domain-containing protein [Methylobacter svalbardensis]|uniref:META domain-containing protein n=1 Tax=Methylobacter svalbardensis TaxID=3080016 RepID=UPI0030EB2561